MAGDGVIGALLVTLGVDTGAFEDGLKSSQGKLSGFGASMASIAKVGFMAVTAAAAAAGAAMIKFGFDAIDAGDDIGDASARLGIAASEYQKLQIAAVKAGGSTELMSGAMDKLNQNLGSAHMGSKSASAAFQALGLDADKLKTGDQAFYAIAKGMEGIKDPAEKAKLSMQLFGKSAGVDMLEVLGAGGDALKQYGNEAQKTGRVMSDEMVKKLGDAKTYLNDTKVAFTQMATVFAGQGVVAIVDFAQKMGPVIEQLKTIGTQIYEYLKPSLDELGSAFKSLASNQALITTLKTIATVVGGAIVLNFKIMVDAITVGIKVFDGLFKILGNSGKILSDAGKAFKDFGKMIIDGLVNGIKNGAQWAVDAIKNLASQMIVGFKKVWGIQSPSKVAAEDGRFIAEGLAKGINDNAYLPLDALDNLSFELMKKLNGDKWKEVLSNDLKSLIGELKTPLEKESEEFRKSEAILKNSLQAKLISQETYNKQMERLQSEHLESMRKFTDELIKIKSASETDIANPEIKFENAPYVKDGVDGFAKAIEDNRRMSDAFASTMKNGLEAALDGDFKSFATSIMKGIADKAFTSIFQTLGDSIFGVKRGANDNNGGLFQAISSVFSSLFGGGRASGGPVNAGTPYLIGEVGPELFVPSTSGTIIPNGAFGNQGGLKTLVVQLPIGDTMHNYMVDIATGKAVEVTGAAINAINTRQQRKATYAT